MKSLSPDGVLLRGEVAVVDSSGGHRAGDAIAGDDRERGGGRRGRC